MTTLSYSLTTAAEATGLSRSALQRHIRSGALKAKRNDVDERGNPIGKVIILKADLDAFLEGRPDA